MDKIKTAEDVIQEIIYEKLSGKLPINPSNGSNHIGSLEEDIEGLSLAGKLMDIKSDRKSMAWEIQSIFHQQRMYNELVAYVFKELLERINKIENGNKDLCKGKNELLG